MATNSGKFECVLPPYRAERKKWRQAILATARAVVDRKGPGWDDGGPFEVVALLYLTKGRQLDKHDVDNRLKDVLDGLQGAFGDKASGKRRDERRLIRNDSSVCRVVVEKQSVPKLYANRADAPGGKLMVRRYKRGRWPLQVVPAGRQSAKAQE